MAEARPRPRPRLVSRQAATGSNETSAVVDEDDLFRRNRGRTAQYWKQLEQSSAKVTPFTRSNDDWDPDDPDDDDPFSKTRKKKRQLKQQHRPRWQGTDVARLLSSDNEDDDVQIVEHTPRNTRETNNRKRERSRSKSLTPPPELPAHQRAFAMNLVRQALAAQPRPPSPTFFLDDSNDAMDLDPELAQIAQAVRQKIKHAPIDSGRTGGPEAVDIKVRWRPHPLNSSVQEQCWSFKMRHHDTFRELFDGVADLAGVMANQLVISYDHKRVFASGTPHSLHIWAEGELEACDKPTAEYMRSHRNNRTSPQDSTPKCPSTASQSDAESEAEPTGGNTIKLILRSATTKDKTFPLTVRSTTTCGAIVQAFLKAAGLPDKYSRVASSKNGLVSFPQLVVDGDKMSFEAEIGNADLEDGDLVEIVGV